MQLLKRHRKRKIIFDPKPEFFKVCKSAVLAKNSEDFLNLLFNTDKNTVCYRPSIITTKQFNFFCVACKTYAEQIGPCLVVVEESADVCGPGKAPASYGTLCRQGLGLGVDIISIGQRPQETDKTSLSQASVIYCFRMQRPADRKYMADELICDESKIPTIKYTYVYRDTDQREISEGKTRQLPPAAAGGT